MQKALESLDVILISGNYASGKSYLANQYLRHWKRINRNDIRKFLKEMTEHGTEWTSSDYTPEMEHLVKHIEITILHYFLERKEKVVIDNTSVTSRSRKRYVHEAQRMNKKIGCIFIDAPVQLCLERNKARPDKEQIPENVISDLHARHELPRKDEGFSLLKVVEAAST